MGSEAVCTVEVTSGAGTDAAETAWVQASVAAPAEQGSP